MEGWALFVRGRGARVAWAGRWDMKGEYVGDECSACYTVCTTAQYQIINCRAKERGFEENKISCIGSGYSNSPFISKLSVETPTTKTSSTTTKIPIFELRILILKKFDLITVRGSYYWSMKMRSVPAALPENHFRFNLDG